VVGGQLWARYSRKTVALVVLSAGHAAAGIEAGELLAPAAERLLLL